MHLTLKKRGDETRSCSFHLDVDGMRWLRQLLDAVHAIAESRTEPDAHSGASSNAVAYSFAVAIGATDFMERPAATTNVRQSSGM
jgi:hypothetical protein